MQLFRSPGCRAFAIFRAKRDHSTSERHPKKPDRSFSDTQHFIGDLFKSMPFFLSLNDLVLRPIPPGDAVIDRNSGEVS
jgi:hypothetical protein